MCVLLPFPLSFLWKGFESVQTDTCPRSLHLSFIRNRAGGFNRYVPDPLLKQSAH